VLIPYALLVTLGALIMGVGLMVIIRIVETLRVYELARLWIILASLIFFFIGYVFTVLRLLNIVMLPAVPRDALVSATYFFGALFVLTWDVLNLGLFKDMLDKGINDQEPCRFFLPHIGVPARKIMAMTREVYSVARDICGGDVHYSVPELVSTHPQIDRGVVKEQAVSGTNCRFYIHHYCGSALREILVRHNGRVQYRSHRPSRPIWIKK
jgi:hypothetical protein